MDRSGPYENTKWTAVRSACGELHIPLSKSVDRADGSLDGIIGCRLVNKVSLQAERHWLWFDLAKDAMHEWIPLRLYIQLEGENWPSTQLGSDPRIKPVIRLMMVILIIVD